MLMLEVIDIAKRFGSVEALREVSFSVEPGERIAIVGDNGAGKSTLLQILAGVLLPDAGDVHLDGDTLVRARSKTRRRVGYVPEKADPPPHLRVDELLHLTASLRHSDPLAEKIRQRLRIGEIESQRIDSLSLGQRRRACLAAAWIGSPVLLLLDEPTNGLDLQAIDELVAMVKEAGEAIVLVSTHDRDFADAIASRRLEMRAGKIVA